MKVKKVRKRRRQVIAYVSPALPQFPTSSRVLAMATTWFFAPQLTLKQADKLVRTVRRKKR